MHLDVGLCLLAADVVDVHFVLVSAPAGGL